MDTLTHGLAGALIGRALPSSAGSPLDRALRRREAWTGFAAAMFPDADALLSPFSPEFYITQHRGVTHSFLLLPVWALLLGVVAALRLPGAPVEERRRGLWRLVLVSGLGVLSHILLDWITSWGTMFFSPASWGRYALDWVFIIDGVLSGLLVLGLIGTRWAGRRGDLRSRAAARASLAAASLYIAFCAVRHADALRVAERIFPRPGTRAAIPQPLSPDRWLLLADDGAAIDAAFVDLSKRGSEPVSSAAALNEIGASRRGLTLLARRLGRLYRSPVHPDVRVIPKADGPLAGRTLASGAAGVFGRFARFPAATEEKAASGATRVVLRDVRFGYLSNAIDPFTYVVWYGPGGKVLSAGFPSERWKR